jgi:hypothetical protein
MSMSGLNVTKRCSHSVVLQATDQLSRVVDVGHPGVDRTTMSSDVDDAAGTVIELTSTIGATAAGLQNTTQTVRTLRRLATGAARHPDRLAALGLALLATSGLLALRGSQPTHAYAGLKD